MGNICSVSLSCDALFSRCLDCTVRKASYVNELKDNLAALHKKLEDLTAARNAMVERVNLAEQQPRKKGIDPVKLWLSRVQAVEAEVTELQELRSREVEKLCLGGYCSRNFKSSYGFGKRVANTLQELNELKAGGVFEEVAQEIPEDPVDEIPMDPTIVGRQSIFDEIWSCLNEEQVGIVGLYGAGGVGKTTLLQQINNSFCNNEGHHFDVVIWTVVSKDHNVEKVQQHIGKKIGLSGESWSKKTLEEKAGDIYKILRNKKFVLLLDDIWERVDLIKLGVPPPKASKIIFTTRSAAVCGKMEADEVFEVKCLEHKEAWELFQKRVGSNALNSHPEIPKFAEIVAKECRGLPLALNTVGRAMACKKKLEEWEDAVDVLRTSAFKFPDMGTEVYSPLKFSYDRLPDDKIRSCFLYCSLFPEDRTIPQRYVIECWLAEGLLGEYDGNRAINRGYTVIGDLVRACLLEEARGRLVMHDVVRDMALWIAREIEKEKENFLVEAGVGISKAPEIGKWEGVKRISLMDNKIPNLQETPRCPNLQTLFLQDNPLSVITSEFFQFMPSLKVLNLAGNIFLEELPSGISNLVSLEHLVLSFTGLRELPEEMKQLVNLKYLCVCGTESLIKFPRKVLSRLLMLRSLYMEECGSIPRAAKDSVLYDGGESLMEELLCLEYLNELSISLGNTSALQKFSSSHKFQSCCSSLCLNFENFKDSKSLNVLLLADMKHLRSLRLTFCDLEVLEIDYAGLSQFDGFGSLNTVTVNMAPASKDLTWLLLAPNLKQISIANCQNMEEVISVEKFVKIQEILGNRIPFAELEVLFLRDVQKLKSIHRSGLPFLRLKEIRVLICPMLKKLPLDCNSAKERKIVITGDIDWWKQLQWEDEATGNKFGSCFSTEFDYAETIGWDDEASQDEFGSWFSYFFKKRCKSLMTIF